MKIRWLKNACSREFGFVENYDQLDLIEKWKSLGLIEVLDEQPPVAKEEKAVEEPPVNRALGKSSVKTK